MVKTHHKKYLLQSIIASLNDSFAAIELASTISVLDVTKMGCQILLGKDCLLC